MKQLSPSASYNSAYLVNFPEDNVDNQEALPLEVAQQDNMNRIAYLKTALDAAVVDVAAAVADVATLDSDLGTERTRIDTLEGDLTTLTNVVGGTNHVGGNYVVTGESVNTSINALDTQLYSTTDTATTTAVTVSANSSNITSLGGKLSSTAFNGVAGLEFASANFFPATVKADVALTQVDKIMYANRRLAHHNFIRAIEMDGDALISGSIYDDLIDDSKIYYSEGAPTSTPDAYDSDLMEFGIDEDTWNYYSIAVTIPSSDNVKMNWNGTAGLTVSVSMGSTYTTISSKNTWTAVDAGTSLIVRVQGTAGARLYNYTLSYEEV